jgi:hypothetical protein
MKSRRAACNRHRYLATVAATAALMGTVALGASAQAVCSAPHSSPTLAQTGAIRTLPGGAGWLQLSVYGQHASELFDAVGNREPFSFSGAEFSTRSVFLTGAVGLLPGLEVWGQVPTHRLSLGGASARASTSTGMGDIRAAARVSPELFGSELPIAVRAGIKVPGSEFPVDATVIPLTEGQADVEVSLESGTSLGPLPMYVFGWVGYRWRTENAPAAREPGDERFAHVAVGGAVGSLTWEVAADGLWGGTPLAQGIPLRSDRRRLVQIFPTVGYGIGPGRLEVTGQLPLAGRNLRAAAGLSAGYRVAWGT